jgi:hypothetical protein
MQSRIHDTCTLLPSRLLGPLHAILVLVVYARIHFLLPTDDKRWIIDLNKRVAHYETRPAKWLRPNYAVHY